MGTARFLMWMTRLRRHLGRLERCSRPSDLQFDELPVHLPDPVAVPAGVVRRSADPARAEPAGAARQGDRGAGPSGQRPGHADMEFLAREVASLRMAVGEVATRDFLRSELRSLLCELDAATRRPASRTPGPGPRGRRRAWADSPSPADRTTPPRRLDTREHPVCRAGQRRPRDRQRSRDQAADHRARDGGVRRGRRGRRRPRHRAADRRRLPAQGHHQPRRDRRGDPRSTASPAST